MTDQPCVMQRSRMSAHACVLALFCLLRISSPIAADDKLSPQIREVINAPRFRHAHWGILVADRGTGEVVYEHNADKLFAPASTTKLYSVATALDALGKDYCFATPVYRRGTVDAKGTLEGDLILVASGDLTLGGRTTPANEIEFTKGDHTYANPSGEATLTAGDPLAGLNQLAKQVAAAGIHRVRGQIVIDARLFDAASGTGSGPATDADCRQRQCDRHCDHSHQAGPAGENRLAATLGVGRDRRAGGNDRGRPRNQNRLPRGRRRSTGRPRSHCGRPSPLCVRTRSG